MLSETKIPKGFQKTELGIIPDDWHIKEFQDVMTGFFSGATPYRGRTEYYKGNIKWITSGELNYNIITDTIEKITEEAVKNTNLKVLPKGTFLFAITGLEAEGTRGSCGITGVEATTNQSCMALFPKDTLDNGYLYHFYVWQGKMLALKYCQGTKQQSYTGKIARTLPIILPPTKSEQTAIATALSDTDVLIENLEKFIAKKRNIKHCIIRQMLTPRENWKSRKIKEIVSTPVTDGPHETPQFLKGGIPFLSVNNLVDNKINLNDLRFISLEDHILFSKKCKPQKNDILLGKAASVGKVAIVNTDFEFNIWSPIALIRPNDLFVPDYIYYFFQTNQILKQIEFFTNSSSQGNIGMGDIEKIEINYPPYEEQVQIAQLLHSIDCELEVMDQKLQKYEMIKQGMMQVLLTGKIRLS